MSRTPRRTWRRPAAIVVLMGVAALGSVGLRPAEAARVKPNIVFIVADDQRWDTLWAMPAVQSHLVARGVSFSNAFAVNPLCCPSRASILTGQYSHSTGVYTNDPPYGGFEVFEDSSTIATWLDGAGYRTGLVGKYLNGYVGTSIPPGWDQWLAISGVTPSKNYYYNYTMNRNGTLKTYGDAPADYSTDVFTADAVSFIGATPTSQPLFLYYAPWAPHEPPVAAPRHANAFSDLPPYRPPNYNEANVSDKPAWVRSLPRFTQAKMTAIDSIRRNQYRALLAVDDGVEAIVDALVAAGRLSNTLIVYTSDNGFAWGEHRWTNKQAGYDETDRVPLVMRYDPLTTSARSDDHLVLNIDFASTFAELAGVPSPDVEGESLTPLLSSEGVAWRDVFLIEHVVLAGPSPPTYCAVRTPSYLYVNYSTREEELYVMHLDPYQLKSRAGDPLLHSTRTGLIQLLRGLCIPPPPGYTLPPPP